MGVVVNSGMCLNSDNGWRCWPLPTVLQSEAICMAGSGAEVRAGFMHSGRRLLHPSTTHLAGSSLAAFFKNLVIWT